MKYIINLFTLFFFVCSLTLPAQAQFTVTQDQMLPAKNYLLNGGFEQATSHWATYADAAGALPVDGTGGSPSETLTSISTTPISGKYSGLITKDAANRQGNGVSNAFAVEKGARGTTLSITGTYEIASGTYSGGTSTTDSDLEVYIYNVDTSTLIQPSGYKMNGGVAGIMYPINATFQTDTTSTNYRLIIHTATTSASAYTVKLDEIKIGKNNKPLGPPVTDWQAYSVTITGNGTGTNPVKGTIARDQGYWRRVGDHMEIRYEYSQTAAGTSGTTIQYYFSLPSGYAIDSTKLNTTQINGGQSLGSAIGWDGTAMWSGSVEYADSSHIYIVVGGSSSTIGANIIPLGNTTARYGFQARVPIAGWSSGVLMSDQTAQTVVAAGYNTASTQALTANTTNIIYGTQLFDYQGAMNAATGVYTVPVPGLYLVNAGLLQATAGTALVYKNGSLFSVLGVQPAAANVGNGSSFVPCVAGDTLSIRSSTTASLSSSSANNFINIMRVSGPNQIAASDSISMAYGTTNAQSLSNATVTTITTWTKDFDYMSMMNASTGVATIPAPGIYLVCGHLEYAVNATGGRGVFVVTTGSNARTIPLQQIASAGAATDTVTIGNCEQIKFITGDTVALQGFQRSGGALALSNSVVDNRFTITRVAN